MQQNKKITTYNPPTEYNTSKVFIIRVEQGRRAGKPGVFYSLVFRGNPEDLSDENLLLQQANVHLKHENLTGFTPVFPWSPVVEQGDLSERTCTFRQITL